MKYTLFIILLSFSVQSYSQYVSAGEKNTGFFKKNNVTMPIIDSYALLDEKINRIVINMFPSAISNAETSKIISKDAFFVLNDKKSPNENKWQWYPRARIILDFEMGKTIEENTLISFYITMTGIEKRGWNENHRWKNKPNRYTDNSIKIKLINGEQFIVFSSKYKLHEKYPDDVYWDFDILTPLIVSDIIDLSKRG